MMHEKLKNRKRLHRFAAAQVKVTDAYCRRAYEKEMDYLMALEPNRLLAGFREVAGLEKKAERYKGWEETEIQGHTLGHYLSALSQSYAYEKRSEVEDRLMAICEALKACQRADGYLFAWQEEIFDRVEERKPAWVPWYTLHKILNGLVGAYQLTKNQVAYEVADRLGDWVYHRCSKWSIEVHQQVLSVEYGGMNDVLYDLYQLTGKEEHLIAAQSFDELSLFDSLYEEMDVLNGRHANTTIPKINGALNRYMVTGEAYFLKVAMNFWEMVTAHHTYITGGNSEWEHFGKPDVLDEERTACNCETCNTYNMLKLTEKLFEVTGDKKYAVFYEKAWANAILASQNPETGMSTYFQPMETGFFKVYSKPEEHFWCCTGTGMENFTKLQEGIFFYEGQEIFISRYLSSTLNWQEEGVKVTVDTQFPALRQVKVHIEMAEEREKKIHLVIPEWSLQAEKPVCEVEIEGEKIEPQVENGYMVLTVRGCQTIQLGFSMGIRVEHLPDCPEAIAFRYGPIVLCSLLGNEAMREATTGVNVSVATKDFYRKDYLVLEEGLSLQTWLSQIENYIVQEEPMVFRLKGVDENLVFVPYFSQHQERYGIYWRVCEKDSNRHSQLEQMQKQRWARLRSSIDCIPVGNDQYELAHHIRGQQTEVTSLEGHRGRRVSANGWVQYVLEAPSEGGCTLNLVYASQDAGCTFDLYINDKLFTKEQLTQKAEAFYTEAYELSEEDLEGAKKIELLIKVTQSDSYCQFFEEIFLSRK